MLRTGQNEMHPIEFFEWKTFIKMHRIILGKNPTKKGSILIRMLEKKISDGITKYCRTVHDWFPLSFKSKVILQLC